MKVINNEVNKNSKMSIYSTLRLSHAEVTVDCRGSNVRKVLTDTLLIYGYYMNQMVQDS
jgi:hypothetical protein